MSEQPRSWKNAPSSSSSRPASWRRAQDPPTTAAREKSWSRRTGASPIDARFRRRFALIAFALAFILLVGFFVVKLLFAPLPVPLLAIAITRYAAPIPPNAYASEDVHRLTATFAKYESVKCRAVDDEEGPVSFERELERFLTDQQYPPGGPGGSILAGKTRIIYLSAHGAVRMVNGQAEPCLVTGAQDALDSTNWLKLADVLDIVRGHTREGARTLLLLDANRIDVRWNMGILYNTFADRAQELVAKDKNLAVIISAASGQHGHVLPEMQASLFGYLVAAGLQGAADNYNDTGRADGTVELDELYRFLVQRMEELSASEFSSRQQPLLAPRGANFPLLSVVKTEGPPPASAAAGDRDFFQRLQSLWQTHDQLRKKGVYRYFPREWSQLEQGLSRLEELRLAGRAYRSERNSLVTSLEGTARWLEQPPVLHADLASCSLPIGRLFGRVSDADVERAGQQLEKFLNPAPGDGAAAESDPAKERAGSGDPRTARDPRTAPSGDPGTAPSGDPGTAPSGGPRTAESASAAQSSPSGQAPADGATAEAIPPAEPPIDAVPAAVAVWQRLLGQLESATPQQRTSLDQNTIQRLVDFWDRSSNPDTMIKEIHLLRLLSQYGSWSGPDELAAGLIQQTNAATQLGLNDFDLRPYYWCADPIRLGDQQLRDALDCLLVNEAEYRTRAAQALEQAQRQFEQGRQVAAQVGLSLETRDEALARLPWFGQWITGRTLRQMDLKDQASRWLLQALTAVGPLEHELAAIDNPQPPNHQQLAQALDEMAYQIDQQSRQLVVEETTSRSKLDELDALMTLPIVPWTVRNTRPLDRTAKLDAKRLVGQHAAESSGETSRAGGAGPAAGGSAVRARQEDPWLKWLAEFKLHPALMWMDVHGLIPSGELAQLATSPQQRLEQQSELVRAALRQVNPEAIRRWITDDLPADYASLPPLGRLRHGLELSDRRVRAASALLPGWRIGDIDPSSLLRKFDAHSFLIQQAQRELDDFWGPDYFAKAAGSYLSAAQQLAGSLTDLESHLERYRQPVMAQQESRKQAADQWPDEKNPLTELGDLAVDPDAGTIIPHTIPYEGLSETPPGVASLYITAGDSQKPVPLYDAQRQPIHRIGTDVHASSRVPISLDGQLVATAEWGLKAEALFRGHHASKRFSVGRSLVVHYEPADADTTVSVRPDPTGRIMLVFDCSATMGAAIDGGESRMTAAQAAVQLILDELAAQPGQNYDVGMVAYGHRVRWLDKERDKDRYPQRWISWSNFLNLPQRPPIHPFVDDPNLTGLHPAADVERLIALQPLGAAARELFVTRLSTLKPTGETPLYLAMLEGLAALAENPDPRPARLIVITDGANNQQVVDVKDVREVQAAKKRLADDVLNDAKLHDTRVDIILFANQEAESQELTRIAQQSGDGRFLGQMVYARDRANLAHQLRRLIHGTFGVEKVGGPVLDPAEFRNIDQLWSVPEVDPSSAYRLRYHGPKGESKIEDIQLRGGEALEVAYDSQSNRLAHQHFLDLIQGPSLKRVPEGRPRFLVGALGPREVSRDEVIFRVTIQSMGSDGEPIFSRRPVRVWARIEPDQAGSDQGPRADEIRFFASEPQFEPGMPVPVLQFHVTGWPADARRALIQLRFAMSHPQSPNRRYTLSGDSPSPFSDADWTLEAQPGSGGWRIIERHAGDAAFTPLYLQLAPPPLRAAHSWLPGSREVRHAYGLSTQARSIQLEVWQPESLQEGWIDAGTIPVRLRP